MVVVEVFCGSGRLTASLKQEGFDAFGIDHVVLKHAACSVLKLDLLCRDSAAHLWRIVADPAVQFIHFAPPCQTASRARDIQFSGAPQALRSEARPEGVDGLVGVSAMRVRKANELYKTTLELISFCLEHGKYFSCENPMRSYLWLLPEWKRLLLREDVIQTSFHHCEYGGYTPCSQRPQLQGAGAALRWWACPSRMGKDWQVLGDCRRDSVSVGSSQIHGQSVEAACCCSRMLSSSYEPRRRCQSKPSSSCVHGHPVPQARPSLAKRVRVSAYRVGARELGQRFP